MADAVTSQTTRDSATEIVMKFTNISDGTGESAVVKVDVSALASAPDEVILLGIDYATDGMGVDILWDAGTPVLAWHVPQNVMGSVMFDGPNGIPNNAGSGKTGDIKFTTTGHSSGDRYSITLRMRKKKTT